MTGLPTGRRLIPWGTRRGVSGCGPRRGTAGGGQSRAGAGPDALHSSGQMNKNSQGNQSDQGHQQAVFRKILSLILGDKGIYDGSWLQVPG